MTLYELLARRYLHGIVFLEFNSMNFSFVLKNKRLRMWVRLREKNASPIWGGKGIPKSFILL
tara:strand:- start:402 stop:587 length:186 start_codon:yes stop_codon:yes gene_type:complete